jgi:glutamate racemase
MVFDLVAGAKQRMSPCPAMVPGRPPRIVVFDSGLGGLSVYPAVREAAPGAALLYVADDRVFPYGALSEAALVDRVVRVLGAVIAAEAPDLVVVACNTASTVVLAPLRARWPGIAFVGTVPAVKPAALASRSRRLSVLATPGTVRRDYTQDLVAAYAKGCDVTLAGAPRLAGLAERILRAEPVADADLRAEIAPAFVKAGGRRTDMVVLACTHYPLILPRLEAVAPWPVTWIDPAPAIARRVGRLLAEWGAETGDPVPDPAPALMTGNAPPPPALATFLLGCGLRWEHSAVLAALDYPTLAA